MSHNCKNNTPGKADTCPCIIKKNSIIYSLNTEYNYFQKQNDKHEFHLNLRIFINLRGVLVYIVDKTLHLKTTQRIFLYFILLPIAAYFYEYTNYFQQDLTKLLHGLWYNLSKQQ